MLTILLIFVVHYYLQILLSEYSKALALVALILTLIVVGILRPGL